MRLVSAFRSCSLLWPAPSRHITLEFLGRAQEFLLYPTLTHDPKLSGPQNIEEGAGVALGSCLNLPAVGGVPQVGLQMANMDFSVFQRLGTLRLGASRFGL